ncbi:MAG TPA: redoxin domain-containing protein [Terriglobales bacterium]|nr:redoxin domain-containing protein [Terriglobales bacterium]
MTIPACGRIVAALLLAVPALGQVPASRPVPVEIGKQVPAFEADLIELAGDSEKVHKFDSHKNGKVVAYIIVGTRCPSTQAYAERMSKLAATFAPKGVEVIYVYPNRDDPREAKVAFHQSKRLGGRWIDDINGRVARLLGALRTTEVFITDTKGTLVYHGAIDDTRDDPNAVKQQYAAAALDQVLTNKAITTPASQVFA